MKRIVEVKINSKRKYIDQQKQDTCRQFDLTTAYKLLIRAYLRAEKSSDPERIRIESS